MAEGAYSVHLCAAVVGTVDLVEHCKLVDLGACIGECARAVAIVCCLGQVPLAGPDGIGHSERGLGLTHAGIHDDNHIAVAVAVVVVVGPVYLSFGLCFLTSFGHHAGHTCILGSSATVFSIGLSCVVERVDAKHIEARIVLAVGLVLKILVHAGSTLRVLGHKVVFGVRHGLVLVLHKQDGYARAAAVRHLAVQSLRIHGFYQSACRLIHQCAQLELPGFPGKKRFLDCTAQLWVMGHHRSRAVCRKIAVAA